MTDEERESEIRELNPLYRWDGAVSSVPTLLRLLDAERARVVELEAALRGLVSDRHGHQIGCACPWCHARAVLAAPAAPREEGT